MTAGKALPGSVLSDTARAPAAGDVPRQRRCLRCDAAFQSAGFGERICRRCKGLNAWRNAGPVSPGAARRR